MRDNDIPQYNEELSEAETKQLKEIKMENEITPKMQLIRALIKVQGAIKNPKKDTDNPYFKSKYADLASTWDSVRDILAKNDLAFVQMPTVDGNKVSIEGIIMHGGGESISSTISGTAKDGLPQSIGSCITYLRRYQMGPMLGICSEIDDDGNIASGNDKQNAPANNYKKSENKIEIPPSKTYEELLKDANFLITKELGLCKTKDDFQKLKAFIASKTGTEFKDRLITDKLKLAYYDAFPEAKNA